MIQVLREKNNPTTQKNKESFRETPFVPLPQTNFSPSPLSHLGGVPSHSVSPVMSPATAPPQPLHFPHLSPHKSPPCSGFGSFLNISGTRHQGDPVGCRALPMDIRAIWGCLWVTGISWHPPMRVTLQLPTQTLPANAPCSWLHKN